MFPDGEASPPIEEPCTIETGIEWRTPMPSKEAIFQEIEQMPDVLLGDVLNFLQSLKAQYLQTSLETCLLSESALAKDWLTPEEDEAWQDL
jgi:hypothetical protein